MAKRMLPKCNDSTIAVHTAHGTQIELYQCNSKKPMSSVHNTHTIRNPMCALLLCNRIFPFTNNLCVCVYNICKRYSIGKHIALSNKRTRKYGLCISLAPFVQIYLRERVRVCVCDPSARYIKLSCKCLEQFLRAQTNKWDTQLHISSCFFYPSKWNNGIIVALRVFVLCDVHTVCGAVRCQTSKFHLIPFPISHLLRFKSGTKFSVCRTNSAMKLWFIDCKFQTNRPNTKQFNKHRDILAERPIFIV